MKTLNESLLEEFDLIISKRIEDGNFSEDLDVNKLREIYIELIKRKDEEKDFDRASRTFLNMVLHNNFRA